MFTVSGTHVCAGTCAYTQTHIENNMFKTGCRKA